MIDAGLNFDAVTRQGLIDRGLDRLAGLHSDFASRGALDTGRNQKGGGRQQNFAHQIPPLVVEAE
jgi:hypothetical protein